MAVRVAALSNPRALPGHTGPCASAPPPARRPIGRPHPPVHCSVPTVAPARMLALASASTCATVALATP